MAPWAILYLLFSIFALTGCRRDMFNQPKAAPLRESSLFANGAASRPLPPHTVARGHLESNEAFYTGMVGTNLVAEFPIPVTRPLLERGRQRFEINCVPCHGETGEGNGIVVQRGFPAPPSYHIERLRTAPAGHYFDVITRGYGAMFSYAARVSPEDRWAITAYIRTLQFSQHAASADLSAADLAALKAAP
ncbi:MAG TPA: cytochrome c [Verrucomicrobiae bacterium]